MDSSEYQNIFNNEDNHFYYVAVHEAVETEVRQALRNSSDVRILDAGCGTGWLAKRLSKFGKVDAIDVHERALTLSRERGVNVTRGSVEEIPFPDNTFDLVTSIDVIYHKAVYDDSKALSEIFRVLKPGGTLVIRVPANDALYSSHDKFVQTARRYNIEQVRQKLNYSCFQIQKASYCQASLFLPALIKARLEARKTAEAHSTIGAPNPILNWILTNVLRVENLMIASGASFPAGIGVLAVARKPLGRKAVLRELSAGRV
jgi:ubiquinone/menaquinone biosynthesis C-methylase UbiE